MFIKHPYADYPLHTPKATPPAPTACSTKKSGENFIIFRSAELNGCAAAASGRDSEIK